jgi:hypothetical protein
MKVPLLEDVIEDELVWRLKRNKMVNIRLGPVIDVI